MKCKILFFFVENNKKNSECHLLNFFRSMLSSKHIVSGENVSCKGSIKAHCVQRTYLVQHNNVNEIYQKRLQSQSTTFVR